jgi:hypothetical protein
MYWQLIWWWLFAVVDASKLVCPPNMAIGTYDCWVDDVAVDVVNTTLDGYPVEFTGVFDRYGIGNYTLRWTVAALNESCETNLTVYAQAAALPCGYGGRCTTVYPYTCDCPNGTSGDHCCYQVGNITCGGSDNGYCGVGGQCICSHGFGGRWCCPEGDAGLLCSGNGCCLSSGVCECSTYSDPNCSRVFSTSSSSSSSSSSAGGGKFAAIVHTNDDITGVWIALGVIGGPTVALLILWMCGSRTSGYTAITDTDLDLDDVDVVSLF